MVDCLAPDLAFPQLRRAVYDAVVLEFPIAGETPERLLEAARRSAPSLPVLIRDPQATLADAVRLARLGADQFLPPDEPPWTAILEVIRGCRKRSNPPPPQLGEKESWRRFLIGESAPMRQVCHIIRMVGSRRATVLITGETGAGKEMAARALHLAGSRSGGPFVAVNCTAIPENLLEDELFGHVRGAFTGAINHRAGRFEQADGGVLLLDEIGELPAELQAKLLRVLQEREFQRLGSSETIKPDVRVIAAANCNLEARIDQGRFREDLYYRLNVVPIRMPPLRERREDIPALAEHFVSKVCREENLVPKRLATDAVEALTRRPWPGNVRQLENAVEMAVALSGDCVYLTEADFPPAPGESARPVAIPLGHPVSVPDAGLDFERTVAGIERSLLEQALRKTGGNKKAAADMLRLKRTTLAAKMRSLDSMQACA